MGNSKSKKNILVIGLSGVGKTHFLDILQYQGDTTKQPTKGYYTCSVLYDTTFITLIEYGATTPFNILHEFDAIFMLIRGDYSMEKMLETKSYLLMCCDTLPEIPLAIIVAGKDEIKLNILQLAHLKRPICQIQMDFDNPNSWQKGCSKLFEWIVTQKK